MERFRRALAVWTTILALLAIASKCRPQAPTVEQHAVATPSLAANKKPNIVFILVDNLGYGELGVYGGGILRGAPTPRIDKLASEGTRLLNFNVEAQDPLRYIRSASRWSSRWLNVMGDHYR